MPTPFDNILDDKQLKLQVGKLIHDKYLGPGSLDLPVGADSKQYATAWLTALGFSQVEWHQVDDDSLFCDLWYTDDAGDHNFMLEFVGPDALTITLWEIAGEVSL